MMECKSALVEASGDVEKARDVLRKKGLAAAAKKAGRATSEGIVGTYIHPGARIGVLVEVDCETDFVAKTPEFQTLVKEIAMHIAAANPLYVTKEEVPGQVLDKEKEIYKAQAAAAGKPPAVQEKIAEGKLKQYLSEVVPARAAVRARERQDGRPAHPGEDRGSSRRTSWCAGSPASRWAKRRGRRPAGGRGRPGPAVARPVARPAAGLRSTCGARRWRRAGGSGRYDDPIRIVMASGGILARMRRRATSGRRRAAVMAAAGILMAMAATGGERPRVAPSTAEMAALLQERAATIDPSKVAVLVNDRRVEMFAAKLAAPHTVAEGLFLRYSHAAELLYAGRIRESLQAIDGVEAYARSNMPDIWRASGADLMVLKGVAYLRLGRGAELPPRRTRPDSCLLPIRGEGVHQKREGSTRGGRDPETRPGGPVPDNLQRALAAQHRAHDARQLSRRRARARSSSRPRVFASRVPAAALRQRGAGGRASTSTACPAGAILDDFDGDGRLDLMLSAMGFADQMRFFRNHGDGTFEERTDAGRPHGRGGRAQPGPGRLRQRRLRRRPRAARRLDGDGGALPALAAAQQRRRHVRGRHARRRACCASPPRRPRPGSTTTATAGSTSSSATSRRRGRPGPAPLRALPQQRRRHVHGRGAARPGVGRRRLREGRGQRRLRQRRPARPLRLASWTATTCSSATTGPRGAPAAAGASRTSPRAAGVTEPRTSFGTFFFDYDNDGWLDLFVAGYDAETHRPDDVAADYLGLPTTAERGRLYRNQRRRHVRGRDAGGRPLQGRARRWGTTSATSTTTAGSTSTSAPATPTSARSSPTACSATTEGRVFQDVTTAGNFGHLQKGHAVAFGDIDNDGDQDVFEEMGGAYLGGQGLQRALREPGQREPLAGPRARGRRARTAARSARASR